MLLQVSAMDNKMILDATCGGRQIWFQKNEPHTLYCDKRRAHFEDNFGSNNAHRTIDVNPDIECNFTNLPFPDNTFNLVVLDPPHLIGGDSSWLKKAFSFYDSKDAAIKDVSDGIRECMRVLKVGGVLIFKWCELHVSTREILDACGIEPLFGHRSGKKSNTHWVTFMKFDDNADLSSRQMTMF